MRSVVKEMVPMSTSDARVIRKLKARYITDGKIQFIGSPNNAPQNPVRRSRFLAQLCAVSARVPKAKTGYTLPSRIAARPFPRAQPPRSQTRRKICDTGSICSGIVNAVDKAKVSCTAVVGMLWTLLMALLYPGHPPVPSLSPRISQELSKLACSW